MYAKVANGLHNKPADNSQYRTAVAAKHSTVSIKVTIYMHIFELVGYVHNIAPMFYPEGFLLNKYKQLLA